MNPVGGTVMLFNFCQSFPYWPKALVSLHGVHFSQPIGEQKRGHRARKAPIDVHNKNTSCGS